MKALLRQAMDSGKPLVMAVLNVTPDSFSDGGLWLDPQQAISRVQQMVDEGADIIDVGGESTRPGAPVVDEQEELRRVIPVIEAITNTLDVPVSIDSSKSAVMAAAVAAGAGMINDVRALQAQGAMETVAQLDVPVCLMHMQGEPGYMQDSPHYAHVSSEVEAFLLERALACQAAGIDASRIVLDPGFGFGKTLEHNLELLRTLPGLVAAGFPVLAGLSRKSMLAAITGRESGQRLAGSLALALLAAQGGATVIRVHDVAETVDVLAVQAAVWLQQPPAE